MSYRDPYVPESSVYPLEQSIIETTVQALKFDERGLIPAIAQDAQTGHVLMMAWMNADSVRMTLTEGKAVYWSRSRGQFWRKGETSGHRQHLVDFRYDCDGDTILLLVEQTGPACHTFRPNCFFYAPRGDEIAVLTQPVSEP